MEIHVIRVGRSVVASARVLVLVWPLGEAREWERAREETALESGQHRLGKHLRRPCASQASRISPHGSHSLFGNQETLFLPPSDSNPFSWPFFVSPSRSRSRALSLAHSRLVASQSTERVSSSLQVSRLLGSQLGEASLALDQEKAEARLFLIGSLWKRGHRQLGECVCSLVDESWLSHLGPTLSGNIYLLHSCVYSAPIAQCQSFFHSHWKSHK